MISGLPLRAALLPCCLAAGTSMGFDLPLGNDPTPIHEDVNLVPGAVSLPRRACPEIFEHVKLRNRARCKSGTTLATLS